MTTYSPNDFQNGVIELFKVRKTYELNIMDCQKKGDVTCELVTKLYNQLFYLNLGQQWNRQKNNKNRGKPRSK
jgi:hypothetical protein